MSTRPLVSILVPVFNAARYLPELCCSIQAQTFANFEAIFADDGSTDESISVLKPFLTDSRFRCVGWPQNRGLNQAWAHLCSLAQGEFWCCPGADDVLHAAYLEKRLELLRAKPNACLVHGPAELIDESGANIGMTSIPAAMPSALKAPRALEVLLQHNIVNQPSAMVRTNVTLELLPHFNGHWVYAPDWFFWILHAAKGGELIYDPQPRHKYRMHSASLSLDPAKDGVRRADMTLVPLCALATAGQFSPLAAQLWRRWRKPLYYRWLIRALKLKLRGLLRVGWLTLGASAFYGANYERRNLLGELRRHGTAAVINYLRERSALNSQGFRVSGLAQIDDPIFR